MATPFDVVVLWEHDGQRCTFRRRIDGRPFEITIRLQDRTIVRAFERDEDASAFAITAMNDRDVKFNRDS